METTTNAASKMVSVTCGRCTGDGRYHFRGGSDVCFGCHGTGTVRMTRTAHEKLLAGVARYEATRWEYEALDRLEWDVASEAASAIESRGVAGAREIFARYRRTHRALCGLVGAMRDAGLVEESNKVVRFMVDTSRANGTDGSNEYIATLRAKRAASAA